MRIEFEDGDGRTDICGNLYHIDPSCQHASSYVAHIYELVGELFDYNIIGEEEVKERLQRYVRHGYEITSVFKG